ncbi:hypothetical protein EP7_005639 (plasmid) [Isosphaeraceae bacterium EP7]
MTNETLFAAGINIGPIYVWLAGIIAAVALLVVFVVIVLKSNTPPE